jgi:hypothetical protein
MGGGGRGQLILCLCFGYGYDGYEILGMVLVFGFWVCLLLLFGGLWLGVRRVHGSRYRISVGVAGADWFASASTNSGLSLCNRILLT